MSAVLKLVQGSPEWHAHRSQSRNASETPVVLGISPWMTPFQLWEVRTGRKTVEVTLPMRPTGRSSSPPRGGPTRPSPGL